MGFVFAVEIERAKAALDHLKIIGGTPLLVLAQLFRRGGSIALEEPHFFGSSDESMVLLRHLVLIILRN